MKVIKFQDKKYEVPTSWDEVTLRQQIDVSQIADKQDHLQKIAIVAGYTGIPVSRLKKARIDEVIKLFEHLSFVAEPLPQSAITEFSFEGEKYNITETLLNGEFQDFIAVETQMKQHENDVYAALPMLIAILAKKSGEHLDEYEDELEIRAEKFKDLPITTANGVAVFFYLIARQSSLNTVVYSNLNEIVQSKIEECKNIIRKRGGLRLRARLLNGILRPYVKSLEKGWEKYWTSYSSKNSKTN